jgi:predicted ATPase
MPPEVQRSGFSRYLSASEALTTLTLSSTTGIGARFDRHLLDKLFTSGLEHALATAEEKGLIRRVPLGGSDKNKYCFSHDQIQQSAYMLIPEEERAAAHLNIGRTLFGSLEDPDEVDTHLSLVVNAKTESTRRK